MEQAKRWLIYLVLTASSGCLYWLSLQAGYIFNCAFGLLWIVITVAGFTALILGKSAAQEQFERRGVEAYRGLPISPGVEDLMDGDWDTYLRKKARGLEERMCYGQLYDEREFQHAWSEALDQLALYRTPGLQDGQRRSEIFLGSFSSRMREDLTMSMDVHFGSYRKDKRRKEGLL